MKIGILGGTFNPVHNAHIYLAKQCQKLLALDKVILIPTFIPPHKRVDEMADAKLRLEMCNLAVQNIQGFEVCDFEIRRADVSYSLITLEYLHEEYPNAELCFLMGTDMFLTVQDWHEPRGIFALATLCACAREEGEYEKLLIHRSSLQAMGAKCELLKIPPMPMSSTEIRTMLKQNKNTQEYIDENVDKFIREHKLYGVTK